MNKTLVLPVLALSACFLSSCGGGGEKHKITFAGENYTIRGEAPEKVTIEVPRGQKIGNISQIKTNDGFVLPDTITVEPRDTYTYEWHSGGETNGVIEFGDTIMLDSDIRITIKPVEVPIGTNKITFTGNNYAIDGYDSLEIEFPVGKELPDLKAHTTDGQSIFTGYCVVTRGSLKEPTIDVPWEYLGTEATIKFGGQIMPNEEVIIYIATFSLSVYPY